MNAELNKLQVEIVKLIRDKLEPKKWYTYGIPFYFEENGKILFQEEVLLKMDGIDLSDLFK